ncbi:MAG TPA: 4'-phosphopantetheinyl transferase superfamily protein [Sedimenticola thiotaurini]|uniref:4'-phosphopantetheinyl transferase superfamily protein n=1 Tax=Sedimenticola thiotaurini TaxID=1543721 RepID=A0A831W5A6_9GAMM|nr:4'-phosphopantetheinyl transferase superfamily protein [Sedimenticola thiotaurini]
MIPIDHWLPSPAPGEPPRAGELHLWVIEPDRPGADLSPLLSADEASRARKMLGTEEARRFTATRGALRRILGGYVGLTADAITFDYGPSGKPLLSDPCPLHFNLSHAGGMGLLVVSGDAPVGIDLEPERERANARAIARRIFSADILAQIGALDDTPFQHAFLHHWTALEARVKCRGGSIFHPPPPDAGVIHFTPRPGWIAAVASVPHPPPVQQWRTFLFSP